MLNFEPFVDLVFILCKADRKEQNIHIGSLRFGDFEIAVLSNNTRSRGYPQHARIFETIQRI
jgi:hypothetical protein